MADATRMQRLRTARETAAKQTTANEEKKDVVITTACDALVENDQWNSIKKLLPNVISALKPKGIKLAPEVKRAMEDLLEESVLEQLREPGGPEPR